MPINLKTILYADSTGVKLEKLNYNFDQLRKNGGGPQGPTGGVGNAGLQGAQGVTGVVGSIGPIGNQGSTGDSSFSYWVADNNGGNPEKKMWINLAHASQLPAIVTTRAPSVLIGITQFHQNYITPNTEAVLTIHKLPYAFDSSLILTNSDDETADYGKINFDNNVLNISYKEEALVNGPAVNGVLRLDATSFEFKSSTPNSLNSNLLDISTTSSIFYKNTYFNKQPYTTTPIADIKASPVKFTGSPVANIVVTLDVSSNFVPGMVAMTSDATGKVKWATASEAGAAPPVGSVIDIDDNIFNEVHNNWVTNTVYALGSYVKNGDYSYYTVNGGTSGGTAPVHLSGTLTDGGVIWLYFSNNPGKNFILKQNNVANPAVNAFLDFTVGSGVAGTKYDGWYLCNGFTWKDAGNVFSFDTQDLNSFKWRVDFAVGGQGKSNDYVNNDDFRTAEKISTVITINGSQYTITQDLQGIGARPSTGLTAMWQDSGYHSKKPGSQFQHIGYSTKRLPRLIYLGRSNLKFQITSTTDTYYPIDVNYDGVTNSPSKVCADDIKTLYNFPSFTWNNTTNGAWVQGTIAGLSPGVDLDIYSNSYVNYLDNLYRVTVSPSLGNVTLTTPPTHTVGTVAHDGISYQFLGPARVYQFPTQTSKLLNFQDNIYTDSNVSTLAPAGWYAANTYSQGYDRVNERGYWDGTKWDILKQENCLTSCSIPFSLDIAVPNSIASGTGTTFNSADAFMTCPYDDVIVFQDSRHSHLDNSFHNLISEGYFNLYDELWSDTAQNLPASQGRYKSQGGDVRTWYNPKPAGWNSGWGSTDVNAMDYNPIMLNADNDGAAMTVHTVWFTTTNIGNEANACSDLQVMLVRQYSTAFNLHDVVFTQPSFIPDPRTGGRPPVPQLLAASCTFNASIDSPNLNNNFDYWFVAKGKNGVYYVRKWNGCCWEGQEITCGCATGPCGSGFFDENVEDPLTYNGGNNLIGGYQPYTAVGAAQTPGPVQLTPDGL